MQIYCFASTFVCPIFWTFFKGVSSHRKHSFLKVTNQGRNGNKYNITTYNGHDYEAFDELDRGFDQIEEQEKIRNNQSPTPSVATYRQPKGPSNPVQAGHALARVTPEPFTNSKSGPNYQDVKKPRECQESSRNVWSEDRIGPEEIAGVLSASACSKECSSRPSCNHWIWHRPAAAGFAHLCVTITGLREKKYDGGTIFGDRGCLAGTQKTISATVDRESLNA